MYLRTAAAIALLMVLTACSNTSSEPTSSLSSTSQTTTTTVAGTTTLPPSSSSTEPSTTTTLPTQTTSTLPATTTTTTELPGEPMDFGPQEGDRLMVIGVEWNDVLNLRALPGARQAIVSRIPPTDVSVFAHGFTRQVGTSIWIEVEHQNFQGWVNYMFVGYEGQTVDATSSYVAEIGTLPVEDTMLDLAMLIAESFVSEEPGSTVTVTVAPSVGDLGEITIDVVGLGDDAIRGLRLHIFAQPGPDGFTLKTIEQTFLCGRGVTAEGLCP